MLEDFNEEAKKAPKPKEVMIKGNSRIFEYSQGELLNKLKNLDNMSEQEAYELLREEYSGILSDIFKRNSNDYKFLLNDALATYYLLWRRNWDEESLVCTRERRE